MALRMCLGMLALHLLLFVVTATPAQAQDLPLPPYASGARAPQVYHLTLEQAEQQALAHNGDLAVGRLNLQAKLLATSAAKRDYLPKIVANVAYFHFSDNLGEVLTIPRGRFGLLPPGGKTVAVSVVNQDSSLSAITLA